MATELWAPIIDGHNDTLLNLYLAESGHGRIYSGAGPSAHCCTGCP